MTELETVVVEGLPELEARRSQWADLISSSEGPAAVPRPEWYFHWWRHFGERDGRRLSALFFYSGTLLVGAAPLSKRSLWLGTLPVVRLESLCSGEDERDEICTDYLGIVARSGFERAVAGEVASALSRGRAGDWDHLLLARMDGTSPMPELLADALRAQRLRVEVRQVTESPYAVLPATWDEYLAALSSSQRYRIRRSLRDFHAWAPEQHVTLEAATTDDEIERAFEILRTLHAERWRAAGKAGVFESEVFRAFHRSGLSSWVTRGNAELLVLRAHGRPIAAHYNLVVGDAVQFYQSGRSLDVPANVQPGIVLHALAIRRAIDRGRREYDFLPGASQYKLGLATDTRPIVELSALANTLRGRALDVKGRAATWARSFRTSARAAFDAVMGGGGARANGVAPDAERRQRGTTPRHDAP